ncbi:hypothetical protein Acsp06_58230 [Actinomycetospora sp. NBRC 106375]|uniref:hypothetical protein n=1 Tax=Actinomycetospora sp. NBRC 106375 TaxID=3032207 RepID=UPI0024A3EBA4|nr:hypothetical protein [Actinomycetospora sp. NBRC 106375]GLZ49638.1 hypothetical protein Acsp06_58230 [Actinomycetospora sp. NBRC 106375]
MDTTQDGARRVEDHAGVAIGRVDDQGCVTDFAGVRIGRVLPGGVVEDFAGIHLGVVAGGPARHAAVA